MRGKGNFSFKKLGIVVMAISGTAMLFCVFLLLFGMRTDAELTDIKANKNNYSLVYSYTVDGKEYKTSKRIKSSKYNEADSKSIEVICLKQAPSVRYDRDLLILSAISFAIGFGFFYPNRTVKKITD